MTGSELHAQAAIWRHHRGPEAALFMEGEAPDRAADGAVAVDALYRVALARGLRLATDLDRLSLQPVPGWRILVGDSGAITLAWPHARSLLHQAPLDLPSGWRPLAEEHGAVVVFVGYGFGLHEHSGDGYAHPAARLEHLVQDGAVAAGAVSVRVSTSDK
jgi:hypothetical protein